MTKDGEWGPKHLYAYVNVWNPEILVNAHCNNNIKILTHGRDAQNIMFYVMLYATKDQKQVFNYSALGNGYPYHITHPVQSEVERAVSSPNAFVAVDEHSHIPTRNFSTFSSVICDGLWGHLSISHL